MLDKKGKQLEKSPIEQARENFQKRVNDLLNEKNWKTARLIKEIEQMGDVKGTSVSNIYTCLSPSFKGFPAIEVIVCIAHVFGVVPWYLLLGDVDVPCEEKCEIGGYEAYIKRNSPITLYATLDITKHISHCPPANISPSTYTMVGGILYRDEYAPNNAIGFNFSMYEYLNNLAEETSYVRDLTFEVREDIDKLSEAAQYLKDGVRQLRKTHRAIRGYLGALGTLSADNYILLCYLLGQSQQAKQ